MEASLLEGNLTEGFDELLFQISKGVTIEKYSKGLKWRSFEQIKEWQSKFGFAFHIYSNDHLINNKPHFHLIKKSEDIDCRFFFDGMIYDCKGSGKIDRKIIDALKYFVSISTNRDLLTNVWNYKNPSFKV